MSAMAEFGSQAGSPFLSEWVYGGEQGLGTGLAFGWHPDLSLANQRCNFSMKPEVIHC
jgi:hypothetical protein